ncbi:dopamine receptor 4-like [Mytilus californianus]|uniref:dopamine receptor 4-like n=1 Tax=Mytilus californianus TaxID=6549 RepID=UPI002247A3D7|nr:dopamine receptor 4-like [Mytilus californianus]
MNVSEDNKEDILFYVLNGYGVTVSYLIINIVTTILGVMILFLNFLVIDTIRRKHELTNTADVLLLSLALADFLTGILVLYNTVYTMSNFQNTLECRFRYSLLLTVAISSGFHLLALTVDRYIKIIKPLHYSRLCKRSTFLTTCISVWIFAILIGLVPTFGWKNNFEETNGDDLLCSFFGTLHEDYLRMVVVLFFIPVILMLILYSHIFKVAHRHSRQIVIQERMVHPHAKDKLSWKFTKTISIIIGVYLLMWLPTGILVILNVEGKLYHKSNSDKGVILIYTSGLAFFNSLLDPIIYAFQISSVKRRFKSVFCCKKQNSVQDQICTVGYTTNMVLIKSGVHVETINT